MLLRTMFFLFSLAALSGCASAPRPAPASVADACRLLRENPRWYAALRDSAADWGAPMGLQLAIIAQESGFDADARPDREPGAFFGLLPGRRPSSALGYAQALDGTWDDYRKETGSVLADRTRFPDAADFIGWYVNRTARLTGIGQRDYRDHYLAYHEGPGGFRQGTWRNNSALRATAERVAQTAERYERQIAACDGLKRRGLWPFWNAGLQARSE